MFETVKTILAILCEKKPPEKKIVLSLDDLCPLWIKYNTSFKQAKEFPKETAEAVAPEPETATAAILPPEEPPAPVDPPVSGRIHLVVQAFYGEVIEPHREILVRNAMLEGINRIMELLETYGDCPSVVTVLADAERGKVTRIGDILARVTLRDHSFNVTRIALQLLKSTYHDPVGYIPLMIIAALGHDLGKAPQLRGEGAYAKADHPRISVSIIEGIFEKELNSHWLKTVTKAIGEHHQSTMDPFSELLKEADGRARQMEIEREEKRVSLGWDVWFDCKEFLRLVGAKVNVIQTGNYFHAFSVDGTVYCDPTFLYETAGAMASEKNVIDITLLRDTDKDKAMRRIVDTLRNADILTDEIGKGYSTRRYAIEMEQANRKKMLLVPLKASAFENRAEFEKIKESHPPVIRGIKPL